MPLLLGRRSRRATRLRLPGRCIAPSRLSRARGTTWRPVLPRKSQRSVAPDAGGKVRLASSRRLLALPEAIVLGALPVAVRLGQLLPRPAELPQAPVQRCGAVMRQRRPEMCELGPSQGIAQTCGCIDGTRSRWKLWRDKQSIAPSRLFGARRNVDPRERRRSGRHESGQRQALSQTLACSARATARANRCPQGGFMRADMG